MTRVKSLKYQTNGLGDSIGHRTHRSKKGRNKKYDKSIKLLRFKGIIK